MNNSISQLIQQLVFHVPGLAVATIGLTLVIISYARLRGAALPATIGCAVYLCAHLVQPIFYILVVPALVGRGPQAVSTVLSVFNFLFSLAYSVSFGMLVWAALAGRSDGHEKPPYLP